MREGKGKHNQRSFTVISLPAFNCISQYYLSILLSRADQIHWDLFPQNNVREVKREDLQSQDFMANWEVSDSGEGKRFCPCLYILAKGYGVWNGMVSWLWERKTEMLRTDINCRRKRERENEMNWDERASRVRVGSGDESLFAYSSLVRGMIDNALLLYPPSIPCDENNCLIQSSCCSLSLSFMESDFLFLNCRKRRGSCCTSPSFVWKFTLRWPKQWDKHEKRERPVIPYSSPDDMKKKRNEVASRRGFKQESRKEVKTNEAQNSTTSETAAGKANIKKKREILWTTY